MPNKVEYENMTEITPERLQRLTANGYRLLGIGETIQRGDQYLDTHWREHEDFHIGEVVQQGHYPIRRRFRESRDQRLGNGYRFAGIDTGNSGDSRMEIREWSGGIQIDRGSNSDNVNVTRLAGDDINEDNKTYLIKNRGDGENTFIVRPSSPVMNEINRHALTEYAVSNNCELGNMIHMYGVATGELLYLIMLKLIKAHAGPSATIHTTRFSKSRSMAERAIYMSSKAINRDRNLDNSGRVLFHLDCTVSVSLPEIHMFSEDYLIGFTYAHYSHDLGGVPHGV